MTSRRSETITPITGKPAEVHDRINRHSVSLRFPSIIERIRKSLEQVPPNLRLFDYWPRSWEKRARSEWQLRSPRQRPPLPEATRDQDSSAWRPHTRPRPLSESHSSPCSSSMADAPPAHFARAPKPHRQ